MNGLDCTQAPLEIRKDIACFQEELLAFVQALNLPTLNYPLKHSFAGVGDHHVYVREITIPAGQLIVGKIHRHEHVNFISRGDVTCVTEGAGVQRLKGPCTLISPMGTKRVLYTHEETVWTTIHVTDAVKVEDAEKDAIAESYAEIGLEEPGDVLPPPVAELAPGASIV